MYQTKTRCCNDSIVSISQPSVHLIVRGKQNKPVEFGAKRSVSLDGDGFSRLGHLRWDAFHERLVLKSQVEAYHVRTGYYPEKVLAGTQENQCYLKQKGIYFAGKSLRRPRTVTEESWEEMKQLKASRRTDYLQRISIEDKLVRASG